MIGKKCPGSSESLCKGCGRNVLAHDSLIGPTNQVFDYFRSVSMRGECCNTTNELQKKIINTDMHLKQSSSDKRGGLF